MTTCSETTARFTAHLDGELTAEAQLRFTDHLAACPHCAREWQFFRKTLDHLVLVKAAQTVPDLLPGIHAKLDQQGLWSKLRLFWQQLDFSMSLPAATATIAVAMVAGVFFNMTTEQRAPDVPGEISQARINAPHAPAIPLSGTRLIPASRRATPPSYQARSAHPPLIPELNAHHPDIFITLRVGSTADFHNMLQELGRRNLVPRRSSNHHLLTLRLTPAELPLLRQALAGHQAVVYPPEAVIPAYPHQQETLLVAIRLQ